MYAFTCNGAQYHILRIVKNYAIVQTPTKLIKCPWSKLIRLLRKRYLHHCGSALVPCVSPTLDSCFDIKTVANMIVNVPTVHLLRPHIFTPCAGPCGPILNGGTICVEPCATVASIHARAAPFVGTIRGCTCFVVAYCNGLHVLTAAHCLDSWDPSEDVQAMFLSAVSPGVQILNLTVDTVFADLDIAILSLNENECCFNIAAAPRIACDDVHTGDSLVQIGNALDIEPNSVNTVEARQAIWVSDQSPGACSSGLYTLLSGAVYGGNSGSPVFEKTAEGLHVTGLVPCKLVDSEDYNFMAAALVLRTLLSHRKHPQAPFQLQLHSGSSAYLKQYAYCCEGGYFATTTYEELVAGSIVTQAKMPCAAEWHDLGPLYSQKYLTEIVWRAYAAGCTSLDVRFLQPTVTIQSLANMPTYTLVCPHMWEASMTLQIPENTLFIYVFVYSQDSRWSALYLTISGNSFTAYNFYTGEVLGEGEIDSASNTIQLDFGWGYAVPPHPFPYLNVGPTGPSSISTSYFDSNEVEITGDFTTTIWEVHTREYCTEQCKTVPLILADGSTSMPTPHSSGIMLTSASSRKRIEIPPPALSTT